MVQVWVIVEGQTEERFIKQLVAPTLRHLQIYIKPMLLRTSSSGKGGAVSFDRLKHYAIQTLRQSDAPVVTTFIDLYALDTDFPGMAQACKTTVLNNRVDVLNQALHQALVSHVGCRPERFIAHIQPHEYEGLLFSDVAALCAIEPDWAAFVGQLSKVRADHDSPEHINDGYETKPSRRLETTLAPAYKKTRHGPLAAERITLATIERECAHFHAWMNRLRKLNHFHST